MATTARPVIPETSSLELHSRHVSRVARVLGAGVRYWHLLSLDAPTVAMLWTWFIAKANGVALPTTALIAMGLAVWLLYAADRLLDSRVIPSSGTTEADPPELEARHYFHRRHQRGFRSGIAVGSVALAMILPKLAPESIRLYLVLGTLLFGYFVLIHASTRALHVRVQRLPKELAVGIFFSAAVYIPTVARMPELRPVLLPAAILFGVLCSLNCLFIYAWEHPFSAPETHVATRFALRFLPHIAMLVILAGLTLRIAEPSLPWCIPAACVLATCLLLLLNLSRRRFSPVSLRAAADLCLLSPVILIPLLNH